MVKRFGIFMVCAGMVGIAFSAVTNLAQIVGIPLANKIVDINSRDYSNPERSYLSFLKSVLTCDARSFVAGFSPDTILAITGGLNPDSISDKQVAAMNELLGGSIVSNCVLTSYSITNLTNRTVIRGNLSMTHRDCFETNSLPIGFINIGGQWKIDKFLNDFEEW